MAVDLDYFDFIKDQLYGFGDFETKSMFGGFGFFHQGLMFGMITADNKFKLKVDEHNQADFEAMGMEAHNSPEKKKGMPYWEVPDDVIEDHTELVNWAGKAYAVAVRAEK
jgi:DNA transformation protein